MVMTLRDWVENLRRREKEKLRRFKVYGDPDALTRREKRGLARLKKYDLLHPEETIARDKLMALLEQNRLQVVEDARRIAGYEHAKHEKRLARRRELRRLSKR